MKASTVRAWVAASVFMQLFLNSTIMKSMGMMLVGIQRDFASATWLLGTIFAVIECVSDLLAPLAAPIGKRFGSRPVVMVSGVMVTAGLVIASLASGTLLLALALNVLLAGGYCMINVLTRAALGHHFENRKFALASGIVNTGNSFSLLTQPPLVQLFIDTYGWRGTMLLLGAISFHLVVCGALLVPVPPSCADAVPTTAYTPLELQSTDRPDEDEDTRGTCDRLKSFSRRLGDTFDIPMMKECKFWIVAAIFVVNRINKGAWLIYFVPHAVSRGFASDVAAAMVTAGGLAQLAGGLLIGLAIFKEILSVTSAMLVVVVLTSASLLVEPWMTSGWLMSANACVFLVSMGTTFALGDVMIREFLGVGRMANALGWIGFISGLFRMLSGFVPGWIYDHSGSYDAAFRYLGLGQLLTAIPLLWLFQRDSRCRRPRPLEH